MAYGDEVITFTNYSSTTFNLGAYGTYPTETNIEYQQTPAQTLQSGAGQQILQSKMKGMLATPWKVYCYWYDPTANMYFGVLIHFGVKDPIWEPSTPYWQVYSGVNAPDQSNYSTPPNNPSGPYTFPGFGDYSITCTPNWSEPVTLSVVMTPSS